MPQKLIMDTLYASISSPWLDLSIFRWTLVTMFLRRPVSVDRRTARMRIRRRPSAVPAHQAEPATSAIPLAAFAGVPAPATAGSSVSALALTVAPSRPVVPAGQVVALAGTPRSAGPCARDGIG